MKVFEQVSDAETAIELAPWLPEGEGVCADVPGINPTVATKKIDARRNIGHLHFNFVGRAYDNQRIIVILEDALVDGALLVTDAPKNVRQ